MIDLKELLIQQGCSADSEFYEEVIDTECSYYQIRDILIRKGIILQEIDDKQIYVASIKVGRAYSVLACQLIKSKLHILSTSKEGLIKQNLSKKAISKIKIELMIDNGKSSKKVMPHIIKKILWVLVGVLILFVVTSITYSHFAQKAVIQYNKAANEFNSYVDDYNKQASKTFLDNIEGIPTELVELNIEKETFIEGLKVLFGDNSISKIKHDTKIIYEMISRIELADTIIEQITTPNETWVIERLKTVGQIKDIETVTEKNNPDGLLNKDGGYIACLYFTVDSVDQNRLVGKSVIEKGTDAGGAIEIYENLKDAEARCEYLSGFDGTILYSGSYALVGTMVIRTSYLLSNSEQLELTDEITQALTRVDD